MPTKPIFPTNTPAVARAASPSVGNAAPTSTVTLASLAMLRVRTDHSQQDYVDYLVPFVKHVLRDVSFRPVTGGEIRGLVQSEFGLSLPVPMVELVLKRLARAPHNVLHKLEHQWHVTDAKILEDIGPRRDAARQEMEQLADEFAAFAKERYQLAWSRESAMDVIVAYVAQFSIECLAAFERKSALPTVPQVGDQSLFVANVFVGECIKRDPTTLERLTVAVKGNMLANALLCPDLDFTQRKFQGVTFFLDTPLVMRLLNLDGDQGSVGVRELIVLLGKLQGNVAVFRHTMDEVRGVLDYYENNIANPNVQHYRMAAIRSAGTGASDIRLIYEKLETILGGLGIKTEHAIPYVKDFQIDETVLAKVLYDDIPYRNERGRDYDVNSMRSVYTLREGKRPRRVEDCVAVLITSNVQLARTAYEFGRNYESTREVSSVVTDFTVANLAWLKSPVEYGDVPFIEMMATSYAAMNPPAGLWDKMLVMVDRLRNNNEFSREDHELLRVSPIMRQELMNLTLGSEVAFTQETAQELLHRIKSDLVRGVQEAYEAKAKALDQMHIQESAERETERRLQEQQAAEQLAEAQRRYEEQQAALVDVQRRSEKEAEEKVRLMSSRHRQCQKMYRWAKFCGGVVAAATAAVMLAILLGSLSLPIVVLAVDTSNEKGKHLAFTLALLAGVGAIAWGIPNGIWGTSIIGLVRMSAAWARRKAYYRFHHSWFGEPPVAESFAQLESPAKGEEPS